MFGLVSVTAEHRMHDF